MELADYKDIQVENYIHNRMAAAERLQFEQQMQEDEALKTEVEELMMLKSNYDKKLIEVKEQINAAETELEQEGFFKELKNGYIQSKSGKSFQTNKVAWLFIAASIIIIVAMFNFYNRKPDYKNLATAAALNIFPNTRSGDSLDKSDSLFNSGSYADYIILAKQILNDDMFSSKADSLIINTGRSYILLNKPQQFISFYKCLPTSKTENCIVRYTAALAYLELADITKAKELLNSVIENKNGCFPYDNEAKELIKQLK